MQSLQALLPVSHGQFKGGSGAGEWRIGQSKGTVFILKLTHTKVIYEESHRGILWHWMKHAFQLHQPSLYQGMIWILSLGKKAHNFNTDNSSNGLLDKWIEFRCIFLFISIHYLGLFLKKKRKMNWISRSQSMGWWALNSPRQSGVQRKSLNLEACEFHSLSHYHEIHHTV